MLAGGKALALLAYLSASPRRRCDRSQLIDLIWADLDRPNARSALRSALHWIKRRTDADLIHTDGDVLILDSSVTSDRDDFLAAIDREDYDAALTLYRGEFLPKFAAPGAQEFEHWANAERLRLRRLFVNAADRHARSLLALGRGKDAIALAKRARDEDPDTESTWRLLLEALIAGRDTVSAASEADSLERLLRQDEREPEPATRALLRLARQPADAPPAQTAQGQQQALHAELVGRAAEYSAIMVAWDAARTGSPQHIHIGAAPGLGKSRLLDDLNARLKASRARLVHLRAQPGERDVPYAAAAQLAATLAALPGSAGVSSASAAALVALNPSLSNVWRSEPDSASGDEALRRRGVALGELIESVADEAPLALLLDDLHWMDPASWRLLQARFARLGSHRVLAVTTARPSVVPEPHEHLRLLTLEPLTQEQVALLVESLGTLPDAPWARNLPEHLLTATGGSPLEVLGHLQELLDLGLLERDPDQGWRSASPDAIADAFASGRIRNRRIESLDRADRWLLLLLAIAGVPLTIEQLAEVSALPAERVADSLLGLESRGLARAQQERTHWMPGHDLIAELAQDLAAHEATRAANAALGKLFATRDEVNDAALVRAGVHLARAGDDGALRAAFRSLVQKRRRAGRRTGPEGLAREFLGSEWTPERQRLIIGALPWRGRSRAGVLTTSGVAIAALLIGLAFGRRSSAPADQGVSLIVLLDDTTAVQTTVTTESLLVDRPFVLDASTTARIAPEPFRRFSDLSPDGRVRATTIVRPEPATDEILLVRDDGTTVLPAPHDRDDSFPLWAPNGSKLVFQTARWSPDTHHYRLATLDTTTWTVQQLTSDTLPSMDIIVGWSPDGTTVHFMRRSMGRQPNSICRVGQDGTDVECVVLEGVVHVLAGSVLDADRLYLRLTDGDDSWSSELDWKSRTLSPPFLRGGEVYASPDGRFAVRQGGPAAQRSAELHLISLADPSRTRQIAVSPQVSVDAFRWVSPPRRTPIASIALDVPDRVALGSRTRLLASGRTAQGTAVTLSRVRWVSRDPAILRVDHDGTGTATGVGSTWLVADAYGLTQDSVTVSVTNSQTTTSLRAATAREWNAQFRAFGSPLPVPVVERSETAIEVPGDDPSFGGGLYSLQSFDASSGFGVEATIRLPRTLLQWQSALVDLFTVRDSARLAGWDHHTGSASADMMRSVCTLSTQAGEGFTFADRIAAGYGSTSKTYPADSSVHAGRPVRFRVQLFEDGRCGVAVNGVPIAMSEQPVTDSAPVRVRVALHSYKTRVRIGPLDAWRGVRTDIDWSRIDSALRSRR